MHQSGFRKGRNAMDPIVCLETEIRRHGLGDIIGSIYSYRKGV